MMPLTSGGDWKDRGHNGPPALTKKALRWLRQRLYAELFTPQADSTGDGCDHLFYQGGQWDAASVSILLDWYMRRADRYARYVVSDDYHGPRFSHGAWTFDSIAVKKDIDEAADAVDQQIDADNCTTLDEWLRRDLKGKLYYRGAPGGMTTAIVIRLRAKHGKGSTAKCPCGAEFVRDRRNAVLCGACRARARAEPLYRRALRALARGEQRGGQ